jgi:glc operon protein GlcG
MSNHKIGSTVSASRALQPTETNPLDFVPDKIPFNTPYGPPISLDRAQAVIHAAVAEAEKRNWKMNVAVVDSGGNLVAFNEWTARCLPPFRFAEHKARAAATFRRETKQFEDGIQLMHLNYLLAFDGIIASRGGIPLIEQGVIIGAIGCSGGTDSQDEIVSKAGAAVINQLPARNK